MPCMGETRESFRNRALYGDKDSANGNLSSVMGVVELGTGKGLRNSNTKRKLVNYVISKSGRGGTLTFS